MQGRHVLVCALDWGLGHAARCVPLARSLQAEGHEVTLASSGRALALLRLECLDLLCLDMPAYKVRYFSANMYLNMASQGPRLLGAVAAEHRWLADQLKKRPIDVLIADNRYGCYHPGVHSIFLSHQLNIQLPWPPLHRLVNGLQSRWLGRFQEVWVPDYHALGYQLAGALAHGLPASSAGLAPQYIGWLSRLSPPQEPLGFDGPLVALLSGPEPQRSRWERQVYQQLKALGEPAVLVRGVTDVRGGEGYRREGQLLIFDHLSGAALAEVLQSASAILCRPGYSTLMDLACLGQRALLVPTPGQTEQMYLAAHCQAQGWAPWQAQSAFDLKKWRQALPHYKGFPGRWQEQA